MKIIVKWIIKKLERLNNNLRIARLRFLGCRVGNGCIIGNIKVVGHENIIIGNFVTIQDNVRLTATNYSKNAKRCSILIKDNNFIGYGSIIDSNQYVELNSHCMIGPYCYITDSNHVHHFNDDVFTTLGGIYKNVIIKKNCWIGSHSIVLPGVIINDNSVVAANSTVLKDINAGTLNAGSPSIEKKTNSKLK